MYKIRFSYQKRKKVKRGGKETLSSQKKVRQVAKIQKLDKEKIQNKMVKINPNISLIKTNIGRLKFIVKIQILSDWVNKPTNKHQCSKFRYAQVHMKRYRRWKVNGWKILHQTNRNSGQLV